MSKAGLSTLHISGQNLKIKYLMYQIPIKILKHASPNLSYQNSNLCISKVQSKMNVCNTVIRELWLWVFASYSQCFYCCHWRVLLKALPYKWYQGPLSNLNKRISDYTYVLDLSICKGSTICQNQNCQFKTKITQGAINRISRVSRDTTGQF